MKKSTLYFILACISIIGTNIFVRSTGAPKEISLLQSLELLPDSVEGYEGWDSSQSDDNRNSTADVAINRIYVNKADENMPINVFVGYWKNQNREKGIWPPRYTSQEWQYHWIIRKELDVGTSSRLKVREFLKESNSAQKLVYYCYIVDGSILIDEFRLRLANIRNVLISRRNNAALFMVTMQLTDGMSLHDAEKYMEAFIAKFLPVVKEYLQAELPLAVHPRL